MAITAVIASAVVGAGTALYTANEQEKAAEKEKERLAREEADRKREAERIARETRPEGEALAAVEFGSAQTKKKAGNVSDFLVTKPANTLGGTGGSGLGFNV